MKIINLLAKQNFIMVNKPLAKTIGVNAAIVFGELCSISSIFNDEEFFYQKEKIEEDTCLGNDAVRSAIKKLQEIGLISVIKKGLPCKNYYTIHEDVLLELLDNITTSNTVTESTSNTDFKISSDTDTHTTTDTDNNSTFNNKNKTKEYINKNLNNIYTPETKVKEPTDLQKINQAYYNLWDSLYKRGLVKTEKPIISNFKVITNLEKNLLKTVSVETLIQAINNSEFNDFVKTNGYSFQTILSGNVMNQLINGMNKNKDYQQKKLDNIKKDLAEKKDYWL